MKIIMVCFGGWSSSIYAKKLEDALKAQGHAATVTTAPLEVGLGELASYDAILVSPQVRHMAKTVKERAESMGKVSLEISMKEYGMVQVDAVSAKLVEALSKSH